MRRYLHQSCPNCRDYFCVDVLRSATSDGEHPITGYCPVCGYHRVIPGRKQSATFYSGKKLDVVR